MQRVLPEMEVLARPELGCWLEERWVKLKQEVRGEKVMWAVTRGLGAFAET